MAVQVMPDGVNKKPKGQLVTEKGMPMESSPLQQEIRNVFGDWEKSESVYDVGGPTTSDQAFIGHVKRRYNEANAYWKEVHEEAEKDMLFAMGDQWDEEAKDMRGDKERPALVFNTLAKVIDQFVGRFLKSDISAKISPVESQDAIDGGENPAHNKDVSLAESLNGVLDHVLIRSKFRTQCAMVLEHVLQSGFGWFRIGQNFLNKMDMERDLWVKCVDNRFSIICDPHTSCPNMTDADYLIVRVPASRRALQARYGEDVDFSPFDEEDSSQDRAERESGKPQMDGMVNIYEFFEKIPSTKRIVQFEDGSVYDVEEAYEAAELKMAEGFGIIGWRSVETHRVYRTIMSGNAVLEKSVEWDTDDIPFVFVPGKRFKCRDNKTMYHSLIKDSMDIAIAINTVMTTAIEQSQLTIKSKFWATSDQIEGHEEEMQEGYTTVKPVLKFNAVPSLGGVPPQPIPDTSGDASNAFSHASLLMGLEQSIHGVYEASLGQKSNETSGVAIQNRDSNSENNVYVYLDHLYEGQGVVVAQLCKLLPKVYSKRRMIRILGEGAVSDPSLLDPQNMADISSMRFDYKVKTRMQSQDREAYEQVAFLMKSLPPEAAMALVDKLVQYMDIDEKGIIQERMANIIPNAVLDMKTKERYGRDQPSEGEQLQMKKEKAEVDLIEAQVKKTNAEAGVATPPQPPGSGQSAPGGPMSLTGG